MKKLGMGIGMILILCMAAGICVMSASYAKAHNYGKVSFALGGGRVKLYNTREFEAEGIEKIKMDYKSQNIVFHKGEKGKIVINEYLFENRKNAEAAMEVTNATLRINGTGNGAVINILAFSTQSERIEVFLPESYIGAVEARTSSGNIKADNKFAFHEFEAAANSGNITCDSITADIIKADTSSGNINFSSAQGSRIMSASSGNIRINGGEGGTRVATSSGNIEVDNASGELEASASSGNIKLRFTKVLDNISAETTSGSIKMEIPRESAFTFEARAASGSIKTDFDDMLTFNDAKGKRASGAYGNKPAAAIHTEASSGSTSVRFH